MVTKRTPEQMQELYRQTAAELSTLTGDTWTGEPAHGHDPDACPYFRSRGRLKDDTRSIWCSYNSHEDRIDISGDWPTTQDGKYSANAYHGEHNPKISVSAARGVAAIAKDIRRRFLPDFVARWDQLAKRVAESDTYANSVQAMRQRIVALVGGASLSQHSEREVWATGYYREIECSDDSVSIKLWSLPFELAKSVIAIVEKYRADNPESDGDA